MADTEAVLYGATLRGNEYGWKPEHFPRALDEAIARGLACIGGQFQFQLPDGTCEMYWLNADSTPRGVGEPWSEYVVRSVAEVKRTFALLLRETDFLAEADQFEFLRDKKAKGENILEALWFVAYFSAEKENAQKVTIMTSALSTPHDRKITLIFLAMCGLLAIAAVVVGIDDNPPGILLAFLAATAFVLAFVHPWRTARKFMFLLLASILGFVLFIILNIILDTVAQVPANTGMLQDLLQSPAIEALNLIIAMICPAAFIVGAVGSVAMSIRSRRRPT